MRLGIQPCFSLGVFSKFAGQRRFWALEKGGRNVAPLGVCYSLLLDTATETEDSSVLARAGLRAPLRLGRWHNGPLPPVLKHGPRSLTCMRVFGWQTHGRNESEFRWDPQGAPSTDPHVF